MLAAMARPLRIEFPGAIYHVTSRGDRREPIFEDDTDRDAFLAVLGRTLPRFDGCALAYCLMGITITSSCTPGGPTCRASCVTSTASTPRPTTAGTAASAICYRDVSRRSWSTATPICWRSVATWTSTRCGRRSWTIRVTGRGAVIARSPEVHRPRPGWPREWCTAPCWVTKSPRRANGGEQGAGMRPSWPRVM